MQLRESPVPIKLTFKNSKLHAWILLRHTYYSIFKCEDDLSPKTGLTSKQVAVLMAIKQAPDPVTQTDVANWQDRDATSITSIIDRMSKDGLVKRLKDLKDRRSVHLVITPKGEKILGQAREPTGQLMMDIMSCLTDKETQTLIKLLDKIRDKTFEHRNIQGQVKELTPKFDTKEGIPWPPV
jgi:DNA-binding MarR family transcriptional regulator